MPLNLPSELYSEYPKKLVSKVKEFVILNSFQATTLAVDYLSSETLNLQSFRLKYGVFLAIILGISLTRVHIGVPPSEALLQP